MFGLLVHAALTDAVPLDSPVEAAPANTVSGTAGDDVLTGTDGTLWGGGDVGILSTQPSGAEVSNSNLMGFSNDGQKMLFASYGSGLGQLYLKDLTTGALTAFGNIGFAGALSGDGDHVVYGQVYYRNGQAFTELLREDLSTGAINTVGHVRGYGSDVAISDDGDRVAYTLSTGTKHHVRGSALEVQGYGEIWSGNLGTSASDLQFHRDGSLSYLVHGDKSGEVDLWSAGTGSVNVAVNAAGDSTDRGIGSYAFSDDLTELVFASGATNMVDGDTGAHPDVFIKDLVSGEVQRVTGVGGAEADGASGGVAISADGKMIAFWSDADNLVDGDADGVRDIFVKNLVTGQIALLCQAGNVGEMHFTPDGFSLCFSTDQAGLTGADTDSGSDIFLKHLFTDQEDKIAGLGGADLISGLAGDDSLKGGAGDDTLAGGAGSDHLNGGGGYDTADYSASLTAVYVNLATGFEHDTSGVDTLAKVESVIASAHDDGVIGDAKDNLISGGDGGDILSGGAGDDTLQGGTGDDQLSGGPGADLIDGGDGYDVADFSEMHAATVDFTAGTVSISGAVDHLVDVEKIVLGAPGTADTVLGSDAADQIDDYGGDNHFDMAGGDDVVAVTGDGDNTIDLGDGADTLTMSGAGSATIEAGDGNDHVTLSGALSATIFGGAGVDVLTGGGGDDLIWASDASLPYSGTDSLYGGGGADALHGGRYQDGGAGNDDLSSLNATLSGGDGDDTFHGGPTVLGGAGDDYVYWNGGSADGGADTDTLDLTGWGDGSAGATVSLVAGVVTVTSGDGTVHNFEVVKATLFDDAVTAANVSTSLFGQDGADTLSGGSAADHLDGGSGDDVLTGHGGGDVLTGGTGADSFVYTALGDSPNAAPDQITDLEDTDLIDLSAIDANAIAAGDQAFVVVASFTHSFGQLVVSYDAVHDRTTIQGDVDGDAVADFTITADGDHHAFSNFAL